MRTSPFAAVFVALALSLHVAEAHAQTKPKAANPALRDVGVVATSLGGISALVGAGLLFQSSPPCLLSCHAHPEYHDPGAALAVAGLATIVLAVPMIVLGARHVRVGPVALALDAGGVRGTF